MEEEPPQEPKEEDSSPPSCRICFGEATSETDGALVSPCACRGSQKFVHLQCLRLWQRTVLARYRDTRVAHACSVCGQTFTYPPPVTLRLRRFLRALVLLSPLFQDIHIYPLIVLGFVWFGSLSRISLTLFLLLIILYVRGLRPVIISNNGVLSLRFVFVGDPVEGLREGMLLVSTRDTGGVFDHSVILLTDYSVEHGASGVIVNKALDPNHRAILMARNVLPAQLSTHEMRERHRYGGPVDRMTYFHRAAEANGAELVRGLYSGGDLDYILGEPVEHTGLCVYHGVARWMARQLDGEVRSGMWRMVAAPRDNWILCTELDRMWEQASTGNVH